jgi:alkylated DNA repair dioxygenase AlkB
MPQLTLFESAESRLADDERGRIVYAPGFVDNATAQAWFAELRGGVMWRAERRMMYDRELDVPRLVGHEAPRRTIHVDLEPGSLLVMDYATQLHYTHAVPKTKEVVGERISLAFRVKRGRAPAADEPAGDGGFYR